MKNTKKSSLTIGIDLGDKSHEICVVNAQARVVSRETLLNNREAFHALSQRHRVRSKRVSPRFHDFVG